MDRAMTHDDIAELLGVYALDAVGADEAAVVAAHVEHCPRCAAELAQHHEVAALLANAGRDASVELWDKIAARLDPSGEPPPAATVMDAALADALPRRLTRRQRRTRWSVTATIGAVAAAAIAVLGVQVGHLHHQLGQTTVSAAAQAARRDPAARTVSLRSTSRPATTVADVVVLPSGSGYLIDSGLQRLAGDRTYQLWGLEHGRTVSLGLLGRAPGAVAFSQGSSGAVTAYAITAEAAGGAVAPTSAPVAESS